jgi:carboxymethylenebutenolidase
MCHSDRSLAPFPPVRGTLGPVGDLELTARDGTRFLAYRAEPALPTRRGIVILPDVRGLHPFYKDLAARFAEAGLVAVAMDYYGRTAPSADRGDAFEWRSHLDRTTPETIALDARACLDHVKGRLSGPAPALFSVGFCFGGASSWRLSGEGLGLAGCIGFYGGQPMRRAGPAIPRMTAPLLMLLAGEDSTPASEFEEFAQRVRDRGVEVVAKTYEGAPHSFFDRTSTDHAAACADAWHRILDFTERNAPSPPRR